MKVTQLKDDINEQRSKIWAELDKAHDWNKSI